MFESAAWESGLLISFDQQYVQPVILIWAEEVCSRHGTRTAYSLQAGSYRPGLAHTHLTVYLTLLHTHLVSPSSKQY